MPNGIPKVLECSWVDPWVVLVDFVEFLSEVMAVDDVRVELSASFLERVYWRCGERLCVGFWRAWIRDDPVGGVGAFWATAFVVCEVAGPGGVAVVLSV